MNIKQLRKFLEKEIDKYAPENIEFDSLITYDANNQKYLYLHFKDRGDDVTSIVNLTKKLLKKKKIKYCMPREDDYKSLIWIPYDQKIKYIIHGLDEIYELCG